MKFIENLSVIDYLFNCYNELEKINYLMNKKYFICGSAP